MYAVAPANSTTARHTWCPLAKPSACVPQVAVALMHKMDHAKHADKAATTQAFAKALHDAWGVGNPECQNGLLLLMAISDRQVWQQLQTCAVACGGDNMRCCSLLKQHVYWPANQQCCLQPVFMGRSCHQWGLTMAAAVHSQDSNACLQIERASMLAGWSAFLQADDKSAVFHGYI